MLHKTAIIALRLGLFALKYALKQRNWETDTLVREILARLRVDMSAASSIAWALTSPPLSVKNGVDHGIDASLWELLPFSFGETGFERYCSEQTSVDSSISTASAPKLAPDTSTPSIVTAERDS